MENKEVKQKVLDRMLGRKRCSKCGKEFVKGSNADKRGICIVCFHMELAKTIQLQSISAWED